MNDDIAQRLDRIEARLSALEHGQKALAARRTLRRKEAPGGVRGTRGLVFLAGVVLLFGGWAFLGGIAPSLALLCFLYVAIVTFFVKPKYLEPAPETAVAPAATAMPAQTAAAATSAAKKPEFSIEADIGKRIFAWLGIIALLVGLTFFVGYSFQNFGNAGKLLVGYGVGVVLFLFGRRLRRTSAPFSYVLEGGAWALVYFMTYATSFVKSLNVIDNPPVTLLLLLIVIAAMALVSIMERSRILTTGAFLLGYGTAAVGGNFQPFVLWTILALGIGALYVSMTLRWYQFSVGASVATYLTYYVWLIELGPSKTFNHDYGNGVIFLILYGLMFGIAHLLAKPRSKYELDTVRTGVVINVGMSFFAAITLFRLVNAELWVVAAVYAVTLAGFYAVASSLSAAQHLRTPYLVLTIAAVTAIFPLEYSKAPLAFFWLIEAGTLVITGALVNARVLRLCGYGVAILASLDVLNEFTYLARGSSTDGTHVAVIVFAAFMWLFASAILGLRRQMLTPVERDVPYAFLDAAIVFLVILTQLKVAEKLVSTFTGLEGVALLLAGFSLKNKHLRIVSIVVLCFTVVRVFLFDVAALDSFGKMISFIALGGLLLAVAYLYNRSRLMQTRGESEQTVPKTDQR